MYEVIFRLFVYFLFITFLKTPTLTSYLFPIFSLFCTALNTRPENRLLPLFFTFRNAMPMRRGVNSRKTSAHTFFENSGADTSSGNFLLQADSSDVSKALDTRSSPVFWGKCKGELGISNSSFLENRSSEQCVTLLFFRKGSSDPVQLPSYFFEKESRDPVAVVSFLMSPPEPFLPRPSNCALFCLESESWSHLFAWKVAPFLSSESKIASLSWLFFIF